MNLAIRGADTCNHGTERPSYNQITGEVLEWDGPLAWAQVWVSVSPSELLLA